MEFFTTDALILDVLDLHDQDRIVTFLTRQQGKKKGVARGAKRRFSRFAGELQPLAKVKVTWFEKEGRDLGRITQVELERSAGKLQQDLDGLLLGSYLVDHLLEFVQDNEPGDLYFRLLDSTLQALLDGTAPDLAARYFEAWVLRLAGIFPPPVDCPACGEPFAGRALLPPNGDALLGPECAAPGPDTLTVGPEVLGFLRVIQSRRLQELAEHPPTAETLRVVEELCRRVRRGFLQRELRSYEVIRRTQAEVERASS